MRFGIVLLTITIGAFVVLGRVTTSTPIIGPIFGVLSQKFKAAVTSGGKIGDSVLTLVFLTASLLVTMSSFMGGLKRLTPNDISSKLKNKLIALGYIDRSMMEKDTVIDKLANNIALNKLDANIDKNESVLGGVLRAGSELNTIIFSKAGDLVQKEEPVVSHPKPEEHNAHISDDIQKIINRKKGID